MRKRTKARECALQLLYQKDITHEDIAKSLNDFWVARKNIEPTVREFAESLTANTIRNLEKIDSIISKYATNWQIKRMATVDRNILRLATYELLFVEDIPIKVSINEAVEIAKKYGDSESGKFVNGILDKIAKEEVKSGG